MCKLAPKGSKLIQTLRASMHRSWHVDCIVLIWTFTVEGHKGRLIFGTLAGKCVMCMQGRVHGYEGYSQTKVSSSNYWEFPCSSQPVYGTQCLNSSLSVTLRVRGHHCQWHSVTEVVVPRGTQWPLTVQFIDNVGCALARYSSMSTCVGLDMRLLAVVWHCLR